MIKSLLNIENQELINKTKNILFTIIKYLDGKSLINYILIIYLFLYDILINESNNNKKKEFSIELLNFFKKGLSSAKMINYNYLSIANAAINNPYIYNLFYITGLNKTSQIINYSINIRILNNSEINNFNLATFINRTSSLILSFVLNKNELIIAEIINKKKILNSLPINNYLYDKKCHNISIILNFSKLTMNIMIDSKEIKS